MEDILNNLKNTIRLKVAHIPQLDGFEDTFVLGIMRKEYKKNGSFIAFKKEHVMVRETSDPTQILVWSNIQGDTFFCPSDRVRLL